MKKNILIFSILLSMSISCKKYEEGPAFSFHSAKHRIIGDWKVVSYTVNGIDSMQYIYKNHLEGKWSFTKTSDDPHFDIDLKVYSDPDYKHLGEWVLSDHNKTIELRFFELDKGNTSLPIDSIPGGKFGYGWEITRLKMTDMKWRLKQGDVYEIHFKPNVCIKFHKFQFCLNKD